MECLKLRNLSSMHQALSTSPIEYLLIWQYETGIVECKHVRRKTGLKETHKRRARTNSTENAYILFK